VNRAQVGVLKQANQVRLSGLLQRQDGSGLESQVRLELLRQLAHQALEWQLADEQLSGLLVTANLSQGNSAWAVAMGLLHAAGSWGGLTRGLGGQLLAWCPAKKILLKANGTDKAWRNQCEGGNTREESTRRKKRCLAIYKQC
jgi:hypothetical protein